MSLTLSSLKELSCEVSKPAKGPYPLVDARARKDSKELTLEKDQGFFDTLLQKIQKAIPQQAEHKTAEPSVNSIKIKSLKKGKQTVLSDPKLFLVQEKKLKKISENDETSPQSSLAAIASLELPRLLRKELAKDQVLEKSDLRAKLLTHQNPKISVDNLEQVSLLNEIKTPHHKEEIRKLEATSDRRFVVIHRRSGGSEKIQHENEKTVAQPVTLLVEGQGLLKSTETKTSGFDMFLQAATENSMLKQESSQPQQPVSMQDAQALRTYLVEKGYLQIVEHACIVLKDQNQGEIKLQLYPENLGKVKIALDWNNNHLVGQIFVENQTVKEIFQQNLDQLFQSFRERGYQSLNLEVSVGGSPQKDQGHSAESFRSYDDHVVKIGGLEEGTTEIVFGSHSERLVNLTV